MTFILIKAFTFHSKLSEHINIKEQFMRVTQNVILQQCTRYQGNLLNPKDIFYFQEITCLCLATTCALIMKQRL